MPGIGVINKRKESAQFEWKIPDFLSLSSQRGYYYDSPSFVFKDKSFHLELQPGGYTTAKNGFLSLYLANESYCPFSVNIALHIKKADGTLIGFENFDFPSDVTLCRCRNFCARSSIVENKSQYVPSGTLTIICDLKHKEDTTKAEKTENFNENLSTLDHQKFIDLDVLSKNFRQFSTNKDSCDVTLQVQDKEFKAHKHVLMARSSVFAAMFQHDTKEKQTGIINIPDCDSESFQKFLDYLYCGELEDISFDCVFHLYGTANKYDVQELKEFCIKYLFENLTMDNVCDIVKLADKYDEEKLRNETQNFIYQNWDKIFLSAEWDRLMTNNLRLAKKILVEMAKTKPSQ